MCGFGNLVDNAIKYMKPEGEAKIYIGYRTNGVRGLFFVNDIWRGDPRRDLSFAHALVSARSVRPAKGWA